MRLLPPAALLPAFTLLVACGDVATDVASIGESSSSSASMSSSSSAGVSASRSAAIGSGSGSETTSANATSATGATSANSQNVVAELYMATEPLGATLLTQVEVDIQPLNPPEAGSAVVGPCVVYPPPIPPPLLLQSPDAGSPPPIPTPGSVTLTDVTAGTTAGPFVLTDTGGDAPPDTALVQLWKPGDVIRSSVTEPIGSFVVSGPSLVPPVVQVPATFSAKQGLTLTWVPDPNAQTMVISLESGNAYDVVCVVPDAQGSLTVDASLFSAFEAGGCQVSADRTATWYTSTPVGNVALSSDGYSTYDAQVD